MTAYDYLSILLGVAFVAVIVGVTADTYHQRQPRPLTFVLVWASVFVSCWAGVMSFFVFLSIAW